MVVATSKRAMISRFDNEPCFLLVMVDGVMLNKSATQPGFDLRQLPRPSEIHGIEVFNGPAAIPLRYGGAGGGTWCGLIAIWTR
jgi:outer membrane cobalamin receptor